MPSAAGRKWRTAPRSRGWRMPALCRRPRWRCSPSCSAIGGRRWRSRRSRSSSGISRRSRRSRVTAALNPTMPAWKGRKALELPDYAPVPKSALGPALNAQGYYVGRVETNLYWVTDATYQSAFLTTKDGVVVLDAPPTIGHNIQRAIDEIATANGVSNKVKYLIYTHHHADHAGASSLFGKNVVRIGHEETR